MGLILSRLILPTIKAYLYKPMVADQADPAPDAVDDPTLDSITIAEDQQSQEQPTDPVPVPAHAQDVKKGVRIKKTY
jgi:hypothetical protein